MFVATDNKGFQLTFRNSITISVQWGKANYATGVVVDDLLTSARSAEIMIWDNTDHTLNFGADEVKGFLSADQVAIIIENTAAAIGLNDLRRRLQAAGFVDIF
jgi:hypothetical protein